MKKELTPKDKVFHTAARLFYQNGYRAIVVDTLAAESGIGKMTLYRHQPSKDDLIAAYLRDTDELFWNGFEQVTKDAATPREKLLAFFESLQEYVTTSACYGCPRSEEHTSVVVGRTPKSTFGGQKIPACSLSLKARSAVVGETAARAPAG